ncbi:MAG: hypothetical protein M1834_003512 [Cirrosporium novae-zelandiae]|nr:MAG: hypothetical protein M1834_003512 [Cirrosporium novae-zelandiae]
MRSNMVRSQSLAPPERRDNHCPIAPGLIRNSVAHRESSPAEYRSYSDYVTFEKYKTINLKGKEDYYEWWRQIVVQDFNRRDLSFETDSLPALSGIAMQIIAKTQDDYLAGLWRHDLSLGLVWVRFRMSYLPSTYLAPSWSWPSVKGRGTVLETKRAGVRFHVIEAHCTPSGKNPAGEVSNGTITLSGLVTCRALNISALADGEDEKKMGYSLDLNDNLARAKREYFLKPKEQRAGWPFELDGFIETEYLPDVPLTGTLGISNLEN